MVAESSRILPEDAVRTLPFDVGQNGESAVSACFHCGTACRNDRFRMADRLFCCQGCQTVFELLSENGLSDYYNLNSRAGIRIQGNAAPDRFSYLDDRAVAERLVDYQDAKIVKVTFRIPAIHCIACVWLLENLFRLAPGVGRSTVNFPRKEVAISFEKGKIKLSEVVALLASLGYEPELKFSDLETLPSQTVNRKLALQLGVAGFAFGNNMLFSIALYLGVDAFSGPSFARLVGYISMALATPVLLYSARDYFRLAWSGIKHRFLTIEVPIAAGILVIYGQSAYEVLSGRGEGYFDSFAGLLFFLLCGRLFQQKTYDRLAFDRDYKSFFPLSITRKTAGGEESVSLSQLRTGDQLLIRNGELIPADATLLKGSALIDYSFVTGEAEPVVKEQGDYLYAGGRQMGSSIEVQTLKQVSQSYLTHLWNQDAFQKSSGETLDTLINQYSKRFTRIVLAIAIVAAIFWSFADASRALKAFTSVLIVACPCALALAAPFTLGTAIRVLGRAKAFVKGPTVIEQLARVDAVVFDKTGTLTAAGAGSITFEGPRLTPDEELWIHSLARHSTHPCSVRIAEAVSRDQSVEMVRSFLETPGCGVEGNVAGREVWMGSNHWLAARGVSVPTLPKANGSTVHVAVDGRYRGTFVLTSSLRTDIEQLVRELSTSTELALLSGDNARERDRFSRIFGENASLHFEQSPLRKLEFISDLQKRGRTVMMVGDGLNDAGALKQSNVGVAVVESVGAFSPASDIILNAKMVPQLGALLRFSKGSVKIVQLSFLLSTLYNVLGIAIAASGRLSPIVCAILMPLSSISVVIFASATTAWFGHKLGLTSAKENS